MRKIWKKYHYKNCTLLVISIILAIILFKAEPVHNFLLSLKDYGYIGAFLSGALFVSTFTAPIGIVLLLIFAEQLNLIEMGLIAGAGSVLMDLIIFSYVKNQGFIGEIKLIFNSLGGKKLSHLFKTKYFSWLLPVIGAIIIASPLPDEMGITLLGIAKLPTWKFIILSFILNAAGIMTIIVTSNFVKP